MLFVKIVHGPLLPSPFLQCLREDRDAHLSPSYSPPFSLSSLAAVSHAVAATSIPPSHIYSTLTTVW